MVEVIYSFKDGQYPFGKEKQSSNTYMQYLLEAKNEEQVNRYRQLNGIIKKIQNNNLMRLLKVLKQNQSFHMLYEYCQKSLQEKLKNLSNQQELARIFLDLQNVFETLIKLKLKAQIYLNFMAIDQSNSLKVWIKPDQIQFLGNSKEQDKKVSKFLSDFYQTQRTRIHLEIQQIFEAHSSNNINFRSQYNNQQKQHNYQNKANIGNSKSPNFTIEGNTLVFKNAPSEKNKLNNDKIEQQSFERKNNQNLNIEERPISKIENSKSLSCQTSATQNATVDLSKMSIAQKVLYYKKLKQDSNSQHEKMLIVKDSSLGNVNPNDLSKSSNNDSNIQIKTEMINKHKMKITASQEVQVQGNSDDDLEKLARQKIALIQKQRHDRSHNVSRQNTSTQHQKKVEHINRSGDGQIYLKGLEECLNDNPKTAGNQVFKGIINRQKKNFQKNQGQGKEINNKILLAKEKAKNILEKYSQKMKK